MVQLINGEIPMVSSKYSLKIDDILICKVDEYNSGNIEYMDGNVVSIREDGIQFIYLSGYRSRVDFVPWKDIVAMVDTNQPYIDLTGTPFVGHFLVFSEDNLCQQ